MKLEFYVKDVVHGTTTGFWKVRLDIPGVDWVKLSNESSVTIISPIDKPPRDYSPTVEIEMYERGHIFRLCDRIGELLCKM